MARTDADQAAQGHPISQPASRDLLHFIKVIIVPLFFSYVGRGAHMGTWALGHLSGSEGGLHVLLDRLSMALPNHHYVSTQKY